MKEKRKDQKKYWVVFTGKTDIWWLKFLKQDYRHCFVIMRQDGYWISIDPLSSFTDIQFYSHLNSTFDLPAWLRKRSYKVLSAEQKSDFQKPAPFMIFTCVEAIKRILGVHKRFIFTPHQLYRYLKKQNTTSQKGDTSWAV
jgi:hypothetical protein